MRREGELTGRERREFADLVRTFFEFDAYDPRLSPTGSPSRKPLRGRRIRSRWRRMLHR